MKANRGNAVVVIIILLALALLGWWLYSDRSGPIDEIPNQNATTTTNGSNNATTTTPNYPVVGSQATVNDIVIEVPKVGDRVTSPLVVRGRARGPWYFEASAPVTVVDATGKILGQGFVMTTEEWMTTEFVPFEGTIRWSGATTDGGALIFHNDNPSGDPIRSKYWVVPVLFR